MDINIYKVRVTNPGSPIFEREVRARTADDAETRGVHLCADRDGRLARGFAAHAEFLRTEPMNDREYVVTHMRGAAEGTLNDDQMWAVYCQGDGFGFLPPDELVGINEGYDWSHIRDSTPEAFARMAALIRKFRGG